MSEWDYHRNRTRLWESIAVNVFFFALVAALVGPPIAAIVAVIRRLA